MTDCSKHRICPSHRSNTPQILTSRSVKPTSRNVTDSRGGILGSTRILPARYPAGVFCAQPFCRKATVQCGSVRFTQMFDPIGSVLGLRRELPATIFGFLDFFRKISRTIKNIVFLDSQDQNKFLNSFRYFYMTWISYMNHYFLAPSPLKTFKSNPRYQNLPGV